ncbi:MAG: L,D-transpeptidase [Alphaproteobacteria bacterium]|nr:L,D-transpeptidase [Alphaproteobacteria bacterium]
MQITRRSLLASALAAPLATPAQAKLVPGEPFPVADDDDQKVEYRYRRQVVDAPMSAPMGTIVVNTSRNWLYIIGQANKAIRFGIGTGKYGDWKGETVVGRLEKWPVWTPTQDHLKRRPDLIKYIQGMPGGPLNPMGARAIYLYANNADTSYRIHGTDVPEHIGTRSTAGCFAMFNADVIWLYDRVKLGTRVVVA